MSASRVCGVFMLATVLTGLGSGSTESISKSVCLEDSVPLLQNVSLKNRSLVINQIYGTAVRQIAKWFMQNSTINSFVDKRYERLLFLDEHGTIWMRNVKDSDEGRYVLVYIEDAGNVYDMEVKLIVLEAPSKHCKASIKLENTYLVAFLEHNDCGRPLASVYWLGYKHDTMIQVLTGAEASTYHACIESPSLKCAKGSKASDYCSSFRKNTNEKLIPKIYQVRSSTRDISIVLQCQSSDQKARRIHWRRNGIQINNNAKYNQMDNFLSIRYLQIGDQYDIYTCVESEGQLESDPYSIDTYGPTVIEFKQNIVMIKEQDNLNVSCLTVCYPLCSVEWSKLDPSSDQQQNSLLKDETLQMTHITREMSGNYSCKVQNLISGAFNENTLSLDVNYGPDEIFVNTSSNTIEVDEFDSITILCIAECFPSCRFSWTEMPSRHQTEDAELKLINVSSNGTYTCRARNPKTDSSKSSEMIKIAVKLDETLIPRISIVKYTALNSSVVLRCSSSRKSKGKFSWMVNRLSIKNSYRYSADNDILYVRHLTAEDRNQSYICIEPRSKLQSDPFWIKLYGPHEVVIHTSDNTTEVYEFSSIKLVCSSDCFPPCMFRWTFSYTDKVKEGAELKLFNVSSNDIITCHVTNPINMNVTVSGTVTIMGKPEDIKHTTLSVAKEQVRETPMTDNPTLRWYLIHVFPGIGGFGLFVCVVFCFRKKCIQSPRVAGVSSNTISAHLNTVESLQVETQSQHYWTIVTNARGELRTSLERDINVEDRGFVCTVYSMPTESDASSTQKHFNSEKLEAHSHPIEIETIHSDSVECDGYINPISSDHEQSKEYFEPRCLHSVEFSEYIHPIPSDRDEFNGDTDPTPYDFNERNRTMNSVVSHPFGQDDHTDHIASDALERKTYLDHLYSENLESDRKIRKIDSNHSDSVATNEYINPSQPDATDLIIDSRCSDL